MTDREKLVIAIKRAKEQSEEYGLDRILVDFKAADMILELLKEQPEIIRCHDCKYCEYPKAEKEWCKKGHLHGNAQTWYCADGERWDDDA